MTILGARPQFIKAAAVSRHIGMTQVLRETLVHTGQHYDANMSDVFFEELGIPRPNYYLGIGGGTHGAMTGRMLAAIEELLLSERPDVVMVYGDTNSTLAGALAAAKLNVPVAHVEAGLRSFNKQMPEEINRVLTDHSASLLFTPTDVATKNLQNEGFDNASIIQSGDVMYDAALHFATRAAEIGAGAVRLGLSPKNYVLATVHRQENTDAPERLASIIYGLAELTSDMPVVLPLHPRTRSRLEGFGLSGVLDRIFTLAPVGYLDMVGLEKDAAVIATDSGGVQKEAFFHKVPCVTFRNETEWTELVDAGWNRLVSPSDAVGISDAVKRAIGSSGSAIDPYGKGDAASAISSAILSYING